MSKISTVPIRIPDDPSPGRVAADRVQGVVMIGLLAFGLWQGIAAIRTPAAERQFEGKFDVAAIVGGRTAGAVNTIMAHDLPTDRLWRTIGGTIRWRVFGSGGPQVWAGDQGWLYLTEELRPWPGAEASMQARADTVRAVADRLHAKGINLVVTVVPDKARIERATLGQAPRSAQSVARYAQFAAMLHQQGIAMVDLDAVFEAARPGGSLYFRTDTHWNEHGAALAAGAVAAAAQAPPLADYRTEAAADLTDGPGDLLRLMSLDAIGDRWAPLLRPLPDRQYLEHTVPAAASADQGGLLDDAPAVPVALIGSSYSLNSNFAGRLQEGLHQPVTNFAKLGGGFAGSAQPYFTGATFRESPPKMIVWEIPERVVGQPADEADRSLAEWAAAPPGKT